MGKNEADGNAKPESPPAVQSEDTAQKKKTSRKVTVRKLYIVDVGTKVSMQGKVGVRNGIADITFEDFSAEHAEQTKGGALKDILVVIMNSVMKSIVASVRGKAAADVM